jgi:hypothetical protein
MDMKMNSGYSSGIIVGLFVGVVLFLGVVKLIAIW